eukprot:TRINITY_DN67320_c0_g1_i1.p1 TRINITY_DN67320_c0_g1~~TRINITY_DN67320_c0_g1_i1.p1  ORF type:complete len:158 (+),score=50.24 TRINITY_DN67320_c0_g1_i1:35-508(+)
MGSTCCHHPSAPDGNISVLESSSRSDAQDVFPENVSLASAAAVSRNEVDAERLAEERTVLDAQVADRRMAEEAEKREKQAGAAERRKREEIERAKKEDSEDEESGEEEMWEDENAVPVTAEQLEQLKGRVETALEKHEVEFGTGKRHLMPAGRRATM